LIVALALCAALGAAFAAIASAKFDTFKVGKLVLEADGGVSPKALPRKRMAPVAVNLAGRISTSDVDPPSHPPALRELVIDFDKNGTVNAKGLPACKGSELQNRPTKKVEQVCGKSIVGKGSTKVRLSFPDQDSIVVPSPLLLFNGGVRGGVTTLYAHAYITVPVPTAIVTTVKLKKIRKGRYGMHTVSKVPRIVGGAGSPISFNLRIKRIFKFKKQKRSFVSARCQDGRFAAKIIKAVFKKEAAEGLALETNPIIGEPPRKPLATAPGATIKNAVVIRPCKPKGK
jgi:hypothetical protein